MTTYVLTAPPQKKWDEPTHSYLDVPPYDSSVTPNKTVFGVKIEAGHGETKDPFVAVNFFDMGYTVKPDPHEEAQKIAHEREMDLQLDEIVEKEQRNILAENTRQELLAMRSKKAKAEPKNPEAAPA